MSQAVLEAPGAGAPDDDEAAAKDGLEDVTELEKIEAERVDGVGQPANGFPTLMLKSVEEGETAKADADADSDDDADADRDSSDDDNGEDDEDDDAAKAVADATPEQRQAYKTAAAEWRAREPVHKGAGDGTSFLQQRAAWQKWHDEGAEKGLDGSKEGARRFLAAYAPSDEAVKAVADAESAALGDVEKKDYSTAQRRQMASEGHALSDGSYPIANTSDLHNAAVLAQSGHGNVAGAKRLIARRAKELGAPNPLTESKEPVGASKAVPPKGKGKVACPTCKGDGKIKDGNMTCPDCKGKGKVKPGKVAAKAGAAIKDGLDKAVAAGIITREAADAAMAEIADAAIKATRPLPADVKPAGHHREPDGSSTIERLEPEAGMATDKDPVADKVPASVGKEASYGVQRFHDATCAAYAAKDVLAAYPALDGIADAIDPAWLTKAAVEAAEAGKAKKAARLTALAEAAGILKDADPAILADGHAFVHKAFTDMYPSEHCSPSSPPVPGSYQRPYLTSGHASEHASGKANVPPSSHVPDPGQFHRGYLTAGHAAPSPANQAAGSANYAAAAKTYAEQSLKALHDHIEATYGGVCPMAPSRSVLPPDLGARNVPQPRAAQPASGVNTIKEGNPVTQDDPKAAFFDGVKADSDKAARKAAKAGQRELAAEVAKALAEQGTVADAASIKALVDAQLTPLREKYEQQISGLRKELDEREQTDPAMAPVRGQIARIPAGTAAPVEKRSLVDEAREREQALLAKEAVKHADYVEYLQKQATSTSPQVREAAQAELDKIGAAAAVTAPA